MARIGMRYAYFCPLTIASNGNETIGVGVNLGKAINADIQIRTAEAKLYAEDGLAESAKEFVGGTITLGTDAIADNVLAVLFGHTITTGELVANADDVAPFGRTGWIVVKTINGATKYRAICLMKTKYSIPNEKSETKGENITFGTDQIVGDVARNVSGDWKKEKTFDNEAEAKTYLNALLGIA